MSAPLVLDSSAVLAYKTGNVNLGELFLMAEECEADIVVPIVSYAEAYHLTQDDDDGMLGLLINRMPSVIVMPLDLPDVRRLAGVARTSTLGVGHAVAVAARLSGYLVTTKPADVAHYLPDGFGIIEV